MWYQGQKRGKADFSPEDLESCMKNHSPGSPDLSILSFESAFHGRMFGSLSTTRSKAIHKVDIPAFDWPTAPFPQLKYPLADHATENAAEETRCLEALESTLRERDRQGRDVAAIVIEPIQSEGGDRHASPAFFQGVREITRRMGKLMIVDEVQTGVGATGRFWAHEWWGNPGDGAGSTGNKGKGPDMVTFSKKFQAAGFYYSEALFPSKPYRNFNTWMG